MSRLVDGFFIECETEILPGNNKNTYRFAHIITLENCTHFPASARILGGSINEVVSYDGGRKTWSAILKFPAGTKAKVAERASSTEAHVNLLSRISETINSITRKKTQHSPDSELITHFDLARS